MFFGRQNGFNRGVKTSKSIRVHKKKHVHKHKNCKFRKEKSSLRSVTHQKFKLGLLYDCWSWQVSFAVSRCSRHAPSEPLLRRFSITMSIHVLHHRLKRGTSSDSGSQNKKTLGRFGHVLQRTGRQTPGKQNMALNRILGERKI